MPTGYTAPVQAGTITDFSKFAMQCARAFGALIMMRDEPSDAPIPDAFTASTSYYDNQIASARARLAALDEMSGEAAAKAAQADYENALAERERRRSEKALHRTRYTSMLAQVLAWNPPSTDHHGLKDFMVQQLGESIKFDCGELYGEEPTPLSGTDWLSTQRAEASRDLEYAERHRAEEIERTDNRNRWLRELRQSLDTREAAA